MQLDAEQRKNLAANMKGFLDKNGLTLRTGGKLMKVSDNTMWKWTSGKYQKIQDANAKSIAMKTGHSIDELTSTKINWKANGVQQALQAAGADRSAGRTAIPGLVRMGLTLSLNGTEISVAQGLQISVLSDHVIRITSRRAAPTKQ